MHLLSRAGRDAGAALTHAVLHPKLWSGKCLWMLLAKEHPFVISHLCPTGGKGHKGFFVKDVFCNKLSKASLTILMDVIDKEY